MGLVCFIFLFTIYFTQFLLIVPINNIILPFFSMDIFIYKLIYISVIFMYIISISKVFKTYDYSFKNISFRYIRLLIFNIILSYLYIVFTFLIISPFLSFASCLSFFIVSLYLYEETLGIDNSNKYLLPLIVFLFYLSLLSISVFVINQ